MIRITKKLRKIDSKRIGKKGGTSYYYASYTKLVVTVWFLFIPIFSKTELGDIKIN